MGPLCSHSRSWGCPDPHCLRARLCHDRLQVVSAPPSAELEPLREGTDAQTDEQDMGMTYEVPARWRLAKRLALRRQPAPIWLAGVWDGDRRVSLSQQP